MVSASYIFAIIFICLVVFGAYIFGSIALTLIAITLILLWFFHFSREKYTSFNDAKITELAMRLATVFPESRNIKLFGSNESFTLNKKHIYLCIKDANGNYYDDNSLMHVLLHEYAHVLCDEIDEGEHKPKFRQIFARLIDKAAQAGIYDPNKPMVANYCGYD